jgi:hypothetical protein
MTALRRLSARPHVATFLFVTAFKKLDTRRYEGMAYFFLRPFCYFLKPRFEI